MVTFSGPLFLRGFFGKIWGAETGYKRGKEKGGGWGRGEDSTEGAEHRNPGKSKEKPIQFKKETPPKMGLAWLHFLHSFHLISRAFFGVEIFEFFGI